MNSRSHYDVAIIGAGMSGLAAGIRLAHFGKSVCIFERHNAVGGLNGFYSLNGRKFDVGLHAMTNFVPPGVKGTPLTKIFRQLRIDRDELALCPQRQSRVAFGPGPYGQISLRFSNDFALMESEVASRFPAQIDGFRRLIVFIKTYDDVSFDVPLESARARVEEYISDPLLEDMLFCPIMYYGSSTEHDMDLRQFVIMFKALYLEGFARPLEGVRLILRVLLDKYRAAGGERRMKCGVSRIISREGRATALVLDDGTEITADHVISSIGSPETAALVHGPAAQPQIVAETGQLSFVETMTVLNRQPAALGWGSDTVIFFSELPRFFYERAKDQVDLRSGIITFPNNFDFGDRQLPEGMWRSTCIANYDQWAHLPEEEYRAAKARWFAPVQQTARRFLPAVSDDVLAQASIATDMFTPRTITRFTGHFEGAIYGSRVKRTNGRTGLSNLYLCGTDQGLLGIVGAIISGISMANFHILQRSGT